MARQLKGKNADKLKGDKKEKMQKTLKRMDDNKEKYNTRLRIKIELQIDKHKADISKADSFIKEQNQKIETVKVMKLKLEGAVISLKEVLNNDTESKPNN